MRRGRAWHEGLPTPLEGRKPLLAKGLELRSSPGVSGTRPLWRTCSPSDRSVAPRWQSSRLENDDVGCPLLTAIRPPRVSR
ncbi:hypothetical protein ACFPM0_31360 [Pseudonocardia sulfidoxydans]|uniref:hypothetical protein n=1 Tax=Pseudonocardia sulfidoxydans TaxID=54011 RepID=UPI0036237E54